MDTTPTETDLVDAFLESKKKLMMSVEKLVATIVTGNRTDSSNAAHVLCLLAPSFTSKQTALCVASFTELGQGAAVARLRKMLKVFSLLPSAIPERSSAQFFASIRICLQVEDLRVRKNASQLLLKRVSTCPANLLADFLQLLSPRVARRNTPVDEQLVLLELLLHLQFHHVKRSKPIQSDLGLLAILRAVSNRRKPVRELANSLLPSLAPVLPHLMTDQVIAHCKAVLDQDESELGRAAIKAVRAASRSVRRLLEESPSCARPLAIEVLKALVSQDRGGFDFRILPKLFQPDWSDMGMGLYPTTPFADVWPHLREGILLGGDFPPRYCAEVIAQYGPEARPKLRELVRIFKEHHGDCGKSSPLLWAILQVGIGTETPNRVLAWIEKQKRTCPHTEELVYLVRNRKRKPEPAYRRRILKKLRTA